MVHIEIRRPLSMLMIIGALVYGLQSLSQSDNFSAELVDSMGGDVDEAPQLAIHTAEDDVRRARLEQQLIDQHIEVLKYQLLRLEKEREIMGDDLSPEKHEEFRQSLRLLVDLLEGKKRADDKMVTSFHQMWDARRAADAASILSEDDPTIRIAWPVEPIYGISATFEDREYEEYFGIPHKAVDIPALQGTTIAAAADATVESVVDNGLGYSYLVLRHDGYATLYGHISEFLVEEGDIVRRGDTIALSGGLPGTKGAGHLTTGPHLHFELISGKGNIDPLKHLPSKGATLRQ